MKGRMSFALTLGCLLFCLGGLVLNHTTDAWAHPGSGNAGIPFLLKSGDYLEIYTPHVKGAFFIEVDEIEGDWIKGRDGLWYSAGNFLAVRKWVKPLPRLANSRDEVAMANIKTLQATVESYRMDNSLKLPGSLEELLQPNENNMNEPYLKNPDLLSDPWGNAYVYVVIRGRDFEIKSLGADGKEGGDGENADISSGVGPPGARHR